MIRRDLDLMLRDPKCVFVGASTADAEKIAGWLREKRVSVRVKEALRFSGLEGVEVWVQNADDIEKAKGIVSKIEQPESNNTRLGEATLGDATSIVAFCESCGRATNFPSKLRGTIENCPHCGQFMDVIDTDGASSEGEIEVREYLLPSQLAWRKFWLVFTIMGLVVFGLLAVHWLVSWLVAISTGGAGSVTQP